ncbi:MAG: ATP-binding protein [Pseudomonadota bacterium]
MIKTVQLYLAEWSVVPSFEGVSEALAKAQAKMLSWGIDPHRAMEIELALAEAMNNSVEHGLVRVLHPRLKLKLSKAEDNLVCSISDNAPSFELPCATNAAENADASVQSRRDGGFGWHIVHSIAASISSSRCNGTNETTLMFVTRGSQTQEGAIL